jgi:hypothetical protein
VYPRAVLIVLATLLLGSALAAASLASPVLQRLIPGVSTPEVPTLSIAGRTFTPVTPGAGAVIDSGFMLRASPRGQAIVTTATRFSAADFRSVEVEIDGLASDAMVSFFWRSQDNADRLAFVQLTPVATGKYSVALAPINQWTGEIIEAAIGVASPREQSAVIRQLILLPVNAERTPLGVLKNWRKTRSWDATSINFIQGADFFPEPSLFWGLASTIAALLATLLCYSLRRSEFLKVSILTAFFSGWLAFDVLWTERVLLQLDATQAQFAGKTLHEKKAADLDAALYEFIDTATRYRLPPERQRVAILTREAPRALVDRAVYHLLPEHQPTALLLQPDQARYNKIVDESDYLLVMTSGSTLRADARSALAAVGIRPTGREVLMASSAAGSLLRIDPATENAP